MEESKKILGSIEITPEIIELVKKSANNIADFEALVKTSLDENTTNLLDIILFGAIHLQASDIHIEPQQEEIRLRVRLDGILQDAGFFDKQIYHHLLSRLKLLSKLKLNVTDKPQDGRFSIVVSDLIIEIRTSSLPAEYGESIVMRILNPQNLSLEGLGLRKDLYELFIKEIKKPNGMIIVTGPTSSGKTTTLYAFLQKIQNPKIKIVTIEDPIEYHLKGVSQTQVSPGDSHFNAVTGEMVTEAGYDFSDGLRSIVRQNPDVILVGEIRDLETAKIALQASLTGHLVLSTIHTNDAAGTIPRLIDLGIEAPSIAAAINMAIGQRLVRKVCAKCRVMEKPSPQEVIAMKKGLKNIPQNIAKEVGLPKDLEKIKIARATEKGCGACNFSGYKGRKGLHEALIVDNEMERFILTNSPVSEIKALAIKKGMITMYQSGLIEIVLGETTFEEVARVVEVDE